MCNAETVLYQLTETSDFMMSFVIVTREDRVILIDGGRPEDMPLLKQYVGERTVAAWILTHAHTDHISGFLSEYARQDGPAFPVERIYCHFPPYEPDRPDVEDRDYFRSEMDECLPEYLRLLPKFQEKVVTPRRGDRVRVDEVEIEFLFHYHNYLTSNLMNDSSLVFKLTGPNKSVLFLGDLGPEGGDVLYEESRDKLKADLVQMAHHGHMNCGMEIYAAAAPEACLWCCRDWLYGEPEIPAYLADRETLRRMGRQRMYGTAVTRRWMEALGVRTHYVTKDGTQRICL